MTQHTRIAVIETRWSRNQNVSVRPLFDLLSESWCAQPHGYHYEMAGSVVAAREAIARVANDERCRALYLAAHGVEAGLTLHNGETLAVSGLAASLHHVRRPLEKPLHGVFLSACETGTQAAAHAVLTKPDGHAAPISWLAGYDRTVNWIDTFALEALFFNTWIRFQENNTPERAAGIVAERLANEVGGLIQSLGFRLFVRHGAGVADLLGARALGSAA
jgi:hypothetical protein